MRHFPSRTLLVSAIALLAACGGSDGGTAPDTYVVQYRLTQIGVTIDSMKYDNGHGIFIKVIPFTDTTVATMSVASIGTVEAFVWGTGGPTGSVKLKESWTLSGVSVQADSATITTTSPVVFSLHAPQHTF
jgi:hypothetical protein